MPLHIEDGMSKWHEYFHIKTIQNCSILRHIKIEKLNPHIHTEGETDYQ